MRSSEGMITCLSHHDHSFMSEFYFSMGNNIFTKIVFDVFSVDLIIKNRLVLPEILQSHFQSFSERHGPTIVLIIVWLEK